MAVRSLKPRSRKQSDTVASSRSCGRTIPVQTMTDGLGITLMLTVLLSLTAAVFEPAVAQQTAEELRRQAEQQLGRSLSNQEILDMLQQSGLSPQQVRERLRQRGYDPSVADPWLRVLEGRSNQVPTGTNPAALVSVLAGADAGRRFGLDTARLGRIPADTARRERMPDAGFPVFGREIFRRATSQFEPVTTGPVPPDYRVGPGDQLVLVLTGAVQQAYELSVSDEGWIVIPEVGRVFVNGRTVEDLRNVLFDRLSESYSSLTGDNPTTRFDVTVGQLRTNQVYVVGEVQEPSAYVVSSLATAMTALYRAGGPTRNGSFREVRVNRGGETIAEIDLYEYLVRGDASHDVRLQQGDIVYVPVAEKQVRLEGPVSRPAIYELRDDEALRDLIRYAGGVEPTADLQRVQIRRVLPRDERSPGRDRAVIDVSVERDPAGGNEITLRDGDKIQVFALLEKPRNRVRVSGGVWRPGTYGVNDSTRLWDLIRKAGGLLPDVYEGRAQIQRLQSNYTRRMIPVNLARADDGGPKQNPRIEGMDQIYIYAQRNLREDRQVSIGGWVQEPGVYPYAEGMTVKDLILRAGGLRMGAYLESAEVSRVTVSQERTDTLSRSYQVPLEGDYVIGGDTVAAGDDGNGEGGVQVTARAFELRNLDAVYVRRAPGYEPQKTVQVTGEVMYPGPYSIQTRGERLTDLMRRAGGLTDEAYRQGLQLWRRSERAREAQADTSAATQRLRAAAGLREVLSDTARRDTVPQDTSWAGRGLRSSESRQDTVGFTATGRLQQDTADQFTRTRVGLDFTRALRNPDSRANVRVEPGDSIHVPQLDPTVTVRGAVGVATKVLHREGADLGYYIEQAGGYRENAAEGRTRVRYANGEIRTRGGGFLFFGGGVPAPDPGSTVFVPVEPPRERGGPSLQAIVGLMSTAASAVATVIIATQ